MQATSDSSQSQQSLQLTNHRESKQSVFIWFCRLLCVLIWLLVGVILIF